MKNIRILTLAVATMFITTALTGCQTGKNPSSGALPSWTENSENKQAIIDYVKDVTDNNSENYISQEDRLAAFDLDGTIFC